MRDARGIEDRVRDGIQVRRHRVDGSHDLAKVAEQLLVMARLRRAAGTRFIPERRRVHEKRSAQTGS